MGKKKKDLHVGEKKKERPVCWYLAPTSESQSCLPHLIFISLFLLPMLFLMKISLSSELTLTLISRRLGSVEISTYLQPNSWVFTEGLKWVTSLQNKIWPSNHHYPYFGNTVKNQGNKLESTYIAPQFSLLFSLYFFPQFLSFCLLTLLSSFLLFMLYAYRF